MNAEQAHRLLDLVKAGVTVPAALVNAALVATGDLTNPQEDEDAAIARAEGEQT